MSDSEQRAGPPKPPPITGPVPMTATRQRLAGGGASSGPAKAAPAAPMESETVSAEAPEAAAPAAPARPSAPARPAAAPARAPARPTPAAAAPAPPERPPLIVPIKPAEGNDEPVVIERLREVLPELAWKRVHGYAEVSIPKGRLAEIAYRLRDHFGYDYLSAVTAVDWLDRIEMIYHVYSTSYLAYPTPLVLRVDLERPSLPDYPIIASLTPVWPGAEFQEREVFDLMGIKFIGHPDLRRILLADDFPGHPLRKDFVFDYEMVLMKHLSFGVEGQYATSDSGPTIQRGAR